MNYIADLKNLFAFNEHVITEDSVFFFYDNTEKFIGDLKSYLNTCFPDSRGKVLNEINTIVKEIKGKADAIRYYMSVNGDLSKLPTTEAYRSLDRELKSFSKLEWYDDFLEQYWICSNGVSIELDKLRAEFIALKPQPQATFEKPSNHREPGQKRTEIEAPLFSLKGSPDEAEVRSIYNTLYEEYINCSLNTFLHYFYNSAIKPDGVIKWVYRKGANTKLLQFIECLTEEKKDGRPLKAVNQAFGLNIDSNTQTSADITLKKELAQISKKHSLK